MTDNEIKLKPCPFCGGEATLYVGNFDVVRCVTPCKIVCLCGVSTGVCRTKEEAIEAWNRRADRPKGKWIEKEYYEPWMLDDVEIYYECSVCGATESGTAPYCSNCGAEMVGDTDGRD